MDPIAEQATKESLSYVEFLDRLLGAESESRAERRLLAKTRLAHFPFHKTLADFGCYHSDRRTRFGTSSAQT